MYSRLKHIYYQFQILEDGSKGISTAVRLALGETQLVEATKKFLEANGVCIDAFNQVYKHITLITCEHHQQGCYKSVNSRKSGNL